MANTLRANGVRTILSPLMQTVFPPVSLPEGDFAAILLTSEAGARAAGLRRRALPANAYCVGIRTAEAARAAGFDARVLGATAAELLCALADVSGPFLYLRGRDASVDLVAALRLRGQLAASAEVYAQEPIGLTVEAIGQLGETGSVVAPLFSARSARLFVNACPPGIVATLWPVVIATPVVDLLPEPLRARATVADKPDGTSMQQAILRVIRSLVP